MDFSLTSQLGQQLKKIKQRQLLLFKKIQKQLQLFKVDHKHPSLKTHKLKGNLSNTWSISIEGDVRMIYTVINKEAVFFLVGSHDEVYRK